MRYYDETLHYHKYARRWRKQRDDWPKILAMDIFRSWESRILQPESLVEASALSLALECLHYGDEDNGRAFLNRTVCVANRVLAEKRCQWKNTTALAGYPGNEAVILRGRTYANWLLGGELDRETMKKVARWQADWCYTKAPDHQRFFDSITMNDFLQAIRAAIIGCDLDYAASLANTAQPLLWHHGRERELWRTLIRQYPDVTDAFDAQFESFFDLVRDPDFQDWEAGTQTYIIRDILALETGMIREMYIINASPHDDPDPQAVLAAVAR